MIERRNCTVSAGTTVLDAVPVARAVQGGVVQVPTGAAISAAVSAITLPAADRVPSEDSAMPAFEDLRERDAWPPIAEARHPRW